MIRYEEFINEDNISKDLYKEMIYQIGDKVLYRINGINGIFKGEIFNRVYKRNFINDDFYCIKADKDQDTPFLYGSPCIYKSSEFPTKGDPDRRSCWVSEHNILKTSQKINDIGNKKGIDDIIYLKDYFEKHIRKCGCGGNNKRECIYCKGTGKRGYENIFKDIRPLLQDKEVKYQESLDNNWFDVDEYWYDFNFYDIWSMSKTGRLLVRVKEKRENEPNEENWWFMNSEKNR
jgi:hypothetical protein